VDKFAHLGDRARIDLLKAGEEAERFDRGKFRELGLEIGTMDHNSLPKVEKWEFSLSRVGLDHSTRQAVVHVWAQPECNEQYGGGFILVVGWDERDGSLHVLEQVVTGKVV